MASSYNTEPPPTATVLVHTSAGPLTISLFAQQTPLTCRNFLQLCLDGYYDNCTFHRISPGFVIQTGDPTGTGEGGQSIYDDAENEYLDDKWARVLGKDKGDRIVFGDELHSRLKFNRRGLVGMAKTEGAGKAGGYGSQFFITLGGGRRELDGHCTLFGRVEGDGIYNVVKIADTELVEGTERPLYPDKILRTEVVEMPRGEAWEAIKRRQTVAERQPVEPGSKEKKKDKARKKKAAGKQMLSFDDGDDGSDDAVPVRPKKAKFNTALINDVAKSIPAPSTTPAKRQILTPSPTHRRTPSFPDPTTQLPLPDQQSPSRSPSPTPPPALPKSKSAALEAEIAALKQSMRRTSSNRTDSTSTHKKSALEAMIPDTATRGRKRPRAGGSHANTKADANAIKMLNAFRARLDQAGSAAKPVRTTSNGNSGAAAVRTEHDDEAHGNDEDETPLCDLHFIANCQSYLEWRKRDRNRDYDDGLMVIDPREKEREIAAAAADKRGKSRRI
ncbi:hypothetical protein DV736_g1441, partial [Chaetothyriales sp. CBS 134916]